MGNGLDTRGVVDGFAKGFGMVDRYYDKEEDRTRRTALDQEHRDYRDQQQDNWQQSFDANADQRERQQSNWQATHDANQAQRNRSHALQIKQNEQSESHRQWSRDRGDEQAAVEASDRKHEQDLEYIKQAYNAATQGMPFDERFYEIVSQPRYSSLDPRRLLDDQMGAAIDRGKRVMDPNDPADINDPESLEAINLLFDHDINSDRDSNPMDGKRRIAGIYPGAKEGTIAGELEMEDGRRVPMTENRGTEEEGDNTVLQQPVEMMIQKLASADMMRQFLQSPKGRAALVNMGRAQGLIAKAPKADYQLIQSPQYNDFGVKAGETPTGVFDKTSGNYRGLKLPDSQLSDKPDAAQHSGRVIVDQQTGERLKSNGTKWLPIK